MPLASGSSRAIISRNIATEIQSGRKQSQAVAIALHTAQPKAKKKPAFKRGLVSKLMAQRR